MKVKVTDDGVTIPKKMLDGAREVEVLREGDRLVLIPLQEEDPIRGLGSNPTTCGVPDGSIRHDRYIYDPE